MSNLLCRLRGHLVTAGLRLGWMCVALMGLAGHAAAAELSVTAPNAVKDALLVIAADFEKQSGHRVTFAWGGSEAITRRVAEGAVFDVVVNSPQGMEQLQAQGKLADGARTAFARSGVAVAVRSGAPRPDISTVAGLKAALLGAESIAISSGASGRYLEQLFQRLGVAEQIQKKIKQPPSGAQIGEMLARGEAELGFQQVTELRHAKGFDYIGTLPAEVQNYTVWSAAPHLSAPSADAARAFIRALQSPAAQTMVRQSGMEPM